jgi:type I restriction-modification system DNA methylase subunit
MAYNPSDFQTPIPVVEYMVSMIPGEATTILEPSPGDGNIVSKLDSKYMVTAPKDFFLLDKREFDCVVMNPPFSSKFGIMENAPTAVNAKGMRLGYYFLTECMKMSNNVIALMPWFTISDSDVRLRNIMGHGLKSLTALPRKTFQYARIQTCVFELEKGYQGPTEFKMFQF